MPMIETINLTKKYGELIALNNLNLTIDQGACYGFIGPNGAGKTTTIKILATLLKPTWGEARIDGKVIGYQNPQIRPLIGYVPDFMGAYEDMVVIEYLEFFAACYNIHGKQRRQVVRDVLDLTELHHKASAEVNGLSRGMKQRLSIARVLLHDPKVLLLDEPASGLDPRARIEIRELLKELRRMGKTILISSHILHELSGEQMASFMFPPTSPVLTCESGQSDVMERLEHPFVQQTLLPLKELVLPSDEHCRYGGVHHGQLCRIQ